VVRSSTGSKVGRCKSRARHPSCTFLYAFGCYACSTAPLQLFGIDNGEVKNITTEERFRPAHAAYLKSMIGDAPEEETDANG